MPTLFEVGEVAVFLAELYPFLNDADLYHQIVDRDVIGQYQSAIGSMEAWVGNYLAEDSTEDTDPMTDDNDDDINSNDYSWILHELSDSTMSGHIDLDDIMVGATHARESKGIDADHLEIFWIIDPAVAQKTLDITLQHSIQKDEPKLSSNYGTGDRIIRYKRIDEYLFIDTFFEMK